MMESGVLLTEIPPPSLPAAFPFETFPEMVQLLMVAVQPNMTSPPPWATAEFPEKLLLLMPTVLLSSAIAPPLPPATFFENAQPVIVDGPMLKIPPPKLSAELVENVQLLRVSEPVE